MDLNQLAQLKECCRDEAAFATLQEFIDAQAAFQVEQHRALAQVITKIRESLDLNDIFQTTVTEVRQFLRSDRVAIFRFYPNAGWNDGEFVSEDVAVGFDAALSAKLHDHCFGEKYAADYHKGRFQAVADIHAAGLKDCHIEVLSRFQIRANLVVPLLQGDVLWGLLCIHQCATPRQWQPQEIEFVQHIATHLCVALQQAELLAQTRQQSLELAEALDHVKKVQAQMIQNEKMSSLGQLVAGVAHEINNPVNFIHGNLNHASQYATDLMDLVALYQTEYPNLTDGVRDRIHEIDLEFILEDFPRMLSSMHVGAERIRKIVLSLRTFSRVDEPDMKPVNIHEGLDSTLLILQYRLKPKTADYTIQLVKEYGKLPPVEGFSSQLNQVFMNLLSNAIDALEESFSPGTAASAPHPTAATPILRIRTEAQSNSVIITIADNGIGMSAATQQKLFEPFFTTKPIGKGTGLGLSISHQIIERHRGRLTCNSQLGQGTEFRIELPLKQHYPEPEGKIDAAAFLT